MTLSRERCRGTLQSHNNSEEGSEKISQNWAKTDVSSVVAERTWRMKRLMFCCWMYVNELLACEEASVMSMLMLSFVSAKHDEDTVDSVTSSPSNNIQLHPLMPGMTTRSIAQFAITINSNVCPHIRVLNTLMREFYAWRHRNTLFPEHVRQLYRMNYDYFYG